MKVYRARIQGLAACLLYALGSSAHLKTFVEQPRGATFLFSDETGKCDAIAKAFFSDHGESGYSVSDAKTLLDCFIEIRKTLTSAIQNDGIWENDQCQ